MARLLLLRAADDAAATARQLTALGHEAIIAPLIAPEATGAELSPGRSGAVIGTSRRAFTLLDAGQRAALCALPAYAVGPATAAAARDAGFADVHAAAGNAPSLAGLIGRMLPGGTALHYLAGETRKPELEAALAAAGFALRVTVVYRLRPVAALPQLAAAALAAGNLDGVLHYSRATATRFAALAGAAGLAAEAAAPRHFCLSHDVAAGLSPLPGARIAIAESPRQSALLALLNA